MSYIQKKRKAPSKETRIEVWGKYDCHCAYCGIELEYKDMQVDHLQPLAFEPTREHIENRNDVSNLMPSCRSCNFYKGAWALKQFRREMNLVHERLMTGKAAFLVKLALRYGIVKLTPFDGLFYFEKERTV